MTLDHRAAALPQMSLAEIVLPSRIGVTPITIGIWRVWTERDGHGSGCAVTLPTSRPCHTKGSIKRFHRILP